MSSTLRRKQKGSAMAVAVVRYTSIEYGPTVPSSISRNQGTRFVGENWGRRQHDCGTELTQQHVGICGDTQTNPDHHTVTVLARSD